MSTSQPVAEKHLAAYTYFRAESEKEPTNYTIMRKCINHGAALSMYTDFNDFLADKPELRDDIFADCERKNLCISRYCEDRTIVEKSDYAMTWIYIHTKEFDKAKKLIDRLPSLDSNNLKESIMPKYLLFKHGFEQEKACITDNLQKFLHATAKQFYYNLESYAWFASAEEAIEFSQKLFGIIEAYGAFEALSPMVLEYENMIRKSTPRCYAAIGDFDKAAAEITDIAKTYVKLTTYNRYKDIEEAKTDAYSEIHIAVNNIDEKLRDKVTSHSRFAEAMRIIESMA